VVTESIPINRVEIAWEQPWNEHHWRALQQAYARAPHFEEYASWLAEVYSRHSLLLADFTIPLTIEIARKLGIHHTRFMRSSDLAVGGQKTDRIIEILTQVGAAHYISGPSASSYIEVEKFTTAGIRLEYMEYNYPEYSQLYPPFDPFVSILDLLFMAGSDAPNYFIR